MRIAQLSDFHFTRVTWNPFRLFSKRIFGNLNWLFKREGEFSEKQLEPLPALFRSLNVDLILFGGDFTTTAMKEEFSAARAFVEKFDSPWIAIPGNHDQYTYRSYRQKHFYRYFSNLRKTISDPIDFFTLENHGVEAHQIAPRWWLVALDTSIATNPYSSQGLLSEKLENSLKEVLQLIPESDSVLFLNHYPFFQNDEARRSLKRGDALEKLLKQHKKVRVYLHGHTHRHTIADLQSNNLPLILDSGSSSHISNGWWNLLDLSEEGCRLTAYQWGKGEWKPRRIENISWTRQ